MFSLGDPACFRTTDSTDFESGFPSQYDPTEFVQGIRKEIDAKEEDSRARDRETLALLAPVITRPMDKKQRFNQTRDPSALICRDRRRQESELSDRIQSV